MAEGGFMQNILSFSSPEVHGTLDIVYEKQEDVNVVGKSAGCERQAYVYTYY